MLNKKERILNEKELREIASEIKEFKEAESLTGNASEINKLYARKRLLFKDEQTIINYDKLIQKSLIAVRDKAMRKILKESRERLEKYGYEAATHYDAEKYKGLTSEDLLNLLKNLGSEMRKEAELENNKTVQIVFVYVSSSKINDYTIFVNKDLLIILNHGWANIIYCNFVFSELLETATEFKI